MFYTPEMDGGGSWFGQEYADIIREYYPGRTFKRCYEWCAGPGFIGFNILDHGLAESLCLSDIYDPAVELCKRTAKHSNNQHRVSAYLFRDLDLLPAREQFDLVVANPPHEPASLLK